MKESPDIKKLLLSFEHMTDSKENLVLLERFWSKDPTVDFIGNAPGNYWRGHDEIMALMKWMLENDAFPQVEIKNIRAYEEGTVGWANYDEIQKLPSGHELEWRESMVFHREDGDWKVVHCHASLPVEDGEAFESNEQIVRKFFEGYQQHEMNIMDEVCDPNMISHETPYPDADLEALKHYITDNLRNSPDIHFTLEEVISKGDRVVVRGAGEGTHTGEIEGIMVTNKKWKLPWIAIFRIANGKIAETWWEGNERVLFAQLGVPTPGLVINP